MLGDVEQLCLCAGFGSSAKRKLASHGRLAAALLTVRTGVRSLFLAQIADFIFCTTWEAYGCVAEKVPDRRASL